MCVIVALFPLPQNLASCSILWHSLWCALVAVETLIGFLLFCFLVQRPFTESLFIGMLHCGPTGLHHPYSLLPEALKGEMVFCLQDSGPAGHGLWHHRHGYRNCIGNHGGKKKIKTPTNFVSCVFRPWRAISIRQ